MKQTAPVSTAIVFVLALNLRPAVTSLGSALEDVSLAPGMTAAVGAVLVALPLWASGIGGWITPWLKARIGIHRAVTWALVILGISLVVRVQNGAQLLIAGTALACLAIAVVGTVLPVLVQPASSRTKASFTLALGTGSTIGALVTPTVVAAFSWQFALAAWALLAVVAVKMWQRAPRSSMVFMARALSPRALFHSRVAWHLTIYFGLVSTLTFLIMGWLPMILRDAGISAGYAGFCLALSMAMGLPMMWLVPFGVHRMRRPGILVVLLAVLNGVGVVGLLVAPAFMPWIWSTGLGLGMGGLAMALTTISVRAAGNPDITTALSGMVQGLGYFIAGVGALACGLLHSMTGSWELPLIMALVVLCGQIWSGVRASRPIVVAPTPIAELEASKPRPANRVRASKAERRAISARPDLKPAWNPIVAPETNGMPLAPGKPELVPSGAQAMLDPDATQPVSGVWVAAVDDLKSVRPESDLAPLNSGVRVTAMSDLESDLAQPVNGAQGADVPEPAVQSANGVRAAEAGAEPDLAHLTSGVRVTALSGPESDLAQLVNGPAESDSEMARMFGGAQVTGPPGPRRESGAAGLSDGVRVTPMAGPRPEFDSARPVGGVPVGPKPESGSVRPVDGVPVGGMDEPESVDQSGSDALVAAPRSESDSAGPESGAPVEPESEVDGLSGGVRVTATAGSDQSDGMQVAAPRSGSDPIQPESGARVESRPEPEVAGLSAGVRVTAAAGSVRPADGAPVEPESEVDGLAAGVRVTAATGSESGSVRPVDGVPVAEGDEPEAAVTQSASGTRVTGQAESDSELAQLFGGAQVTGAPEPRQESGLADQTEGVRVTAEVEPGVRVVPRRPANGGPGGQEPGSDQPVNGGESGQARSANGVWITASVQPEHLARGVRRTGGRRPSLMNFTNGAGIPVPWPPERDLASPESDVAGLVRQELAANGVRVTAEAEPQAESDLVRLSNGGVVTMVAEATIPSPRRPLAQPPAVPPVVQPVQSETATQEG